MIKVIASDMDGTLLNSQHEISEENVKAIKKAQELGVHFIIATGRMYKDVKPFVEKHGIKCEYILMNGAEFRNESGEIVESICIDKSKVKDILDIISRMGLIVELYTGNGTYTTNTKEEALKEMVYRVQNFEKVSDYDEALEIAKKHEHFMSLNYITDIDEFLDSDIEIRKMITFHNDVNVINSTKKELNKLEGLAVLSSFITNIEITDEKAQKGYILKKVTEKMDIKSKEVIALGDSLNDYSLFTEFELAFAMGNAIPEIKEIANNITDTNDNDGVAKAIYKMLEV